MSYNHEPFSATLSYGKFVTTKTLDVSRRAFRPEQLRVKK